MSKRPGLYFDIGKKARGVLHTDYAQQPPMQFHYKFFDWNFDLSCQLEANVPGLRSLFECTIPDSGKVELQYLNNYIGITGCIGLLGNEEGEYGPAVNFSGIIGTSILSLGANFSFDIPTKTVDKLHAGLSLNAPYLAASLTLHDNFDTLKASCFLDVNPLTKTAIAAEVKHSLSEKETGYTFGAQHALSPYTLVKARFDSNGKVGALIQRGLFWQRFFITMAGELNFRDEDRIPKVGVSVALRP